MRGQGQGMGKGNGMGMRQNCMKNQPAFAEYDLNNDGKITKSELEEARAKRMNQKAKEGKMLRNAGNAPAFSNMDINNDGSLNQEEFRLHQTEQINKCKTRNCATGNCPNPGKGQGKGMMRKAGNAPTFADIDTNKDGVISQEEFSNHQTQRMQNNRN
jgi:Ca2+-binding EF-hand superfamily protein